MLTKTEARSWIANIVGCDINLIHTSNIELDYILTLEGDYRELAVWQAAQAVMIQQMKSEAAIANLSSLIKQKSEMLVKEEQVKDYNSSMIQYSDYISFNDLASLPAGPSVPPLANYLQQAASSNSWGNLADLAGQAWSQGAQGQLGALGGIGYVPVPVPQPPVEDLKPAPPKVKAQEEVKGRKFRNV